MDEDELIKSILGGFHGKSVRMPQMIPKVFDHHGVSLDKMLRSYAIKLAIEMDPENEKLKKLQKLLKRNGNL